MFPTLAILCVSAIYGHKHFYSQFETKRNESFSTRNVFKFSISVHQSRLKNAVMSRQGSNTMIIGRFLFNLNFHRESNGTKSTDKEK